MNTVHTSYIIASKRDTNNAEVVEANAVRARVAELSGRGDLLGIASIAESLRLRGRVYIVTNHNSPGRALYGRGMTVSRVTESIPHGAQS